MSERKSKIHQARQAVDKSAGRVVQCLRARAFAARPTASKQLRTTMERSLASHVEIATSLRSLSYFAKPYHSWERGLNEHTNGLFRQYFPKGSDLSIVSIPMSKGSRINSTLAPKDTRLQNSS